MAHGLLVTDSFILKDMYNINLKAYLDLTCTIKDNLEECIQLLEVGVKIDIIIVQSRIQQEQIAKGIYNYLLARDFEEIPIIVLGQDNEIARNSGVTTVENIYDVKSVIKLAAKILRISAKDMAEKIVPDFFPFPIGIFEHLDVTDFDIYHCSEQGLSHKKDDNTCYIKVIEQGTSPRGKVKRYQKEGIQFLYVKADQRLKFTNFFSQKIISVLEKKNLSAEERVESTQIGYDFVAQHIEEVENVSDLMEISKQCVSSMDLIIDEQPEIKKLLTNLFNNQTSYSFKHCQLNAFISSHIINEIDWGTKEHREKLTFIAFYHDILLTKKEMVIIHSNDALKNSTLNDEEKKLVNEHAYQTSLLIQRIPRAPLGADTIIKQHHGMISGVGFEDKKFSNNLSPLAIVFMIAEEYAAAILRSEKIIDGFPNYDSFNHKDTLGYLYKKYPNSNYTRAIVTLEKIKLQ